MTTATDTVGSVQLPLQSPPGRNGFTPSAYQQAIFAEVQRGLDGPDLFVAAVAGSGKTTTIVHAARFIDRPGLFAAFNVSIVDELNRRLAGTPMSAINFHKIGKRALDTHLGHRTRVDRRKYSQLAKDWVAQHFDHLKPDQRQIVTANLAALAGFTRKTLTAPTDRDAVLKLASHHDIFLPDEALPGLAEILRQGEHIARTRYEIDFDDMLYLPVTWQVPLQQFDWVFVDEAQDLSPAQLELILRCRQDGGRMVFVGDERQAIYGFAGADNRSVARIIERVGAKRMPLSICYRCPSSHLALAREIVPHIEARPDAPAGELRHIHEQELAQRVKPGDLVLCRLTAPLVEQCIRFIMQGLSARVEGRDIGKALTDIVRQVAQRPGFDYRQITGHLVAYRSEQLEYLRQKGADDEALQSLEDRVAAVLVCVRSFGASDVDDLCRRIEQLFDARRPQIKLATVHRAKGLEADRVFILKPDKLPLLRPGQQPWQLEQEMNLKYVALTRAKQSLFIVDNPDSDSTDDKADNATREASDTTETTAEATPDREVSTDPAALLRRIEQLEARITALETALARLEHDS